jgi:hypothetical protein
MRRESLIPFLPAALAAVTDVLTAGIVVAHQPDYPATVVVYQVVMFGAALLAAVPSKWMRFVAFGMLLAGVGITALSVGVFYLPTFFAVVWLMVKDGPMPVPPGQDRPGK